MTVKGAPEPAGIVIDESAHCVSVQIVVTIEVTSTIETVTRGDKVPEMVVLPMVQRLVVVKTLKEAGQPTIFDFMAAVSITRMTRGLRTSESPSR